MNKSAKGIIWLIIFLVLLISIMISTWSGKAPLKDKEGQLEDTYRINNYQYYEPILSGGGLYRSDGGYYIGEFSNIETENPKKKRNGFGTMYYPDGCILTGQRINGIVEGKGTYDCNEGIYSGEFKNNKINGVGILLNKDNSFYSGERLDEEPHGYGILKYQDGESYEGYRMNGMKEGTGKYIWNDGKIFEGMFVQGKKNGIGKLINPDGTVQEGIWKDDEFQEVL